MVLYIHNYQCTEGEFMITIDSIQHSYPEGPHFRLRRPKGHPLYTFLHFHTSIIVFDDKKTIELPPHAVIIYKPGSKQYFTANGPLIHDWIHFAGDFSSILRKTELELDKFYFPKNSEFIEEIVYELEMNFYSNKKNKEHFLQLKFEELFFKLDRELNNKENQLSRGVLEQLMELRKKMYSSLEHNWTVKDMAKELSVCESKVYSLYKNAFGVSPVADLIDKKINMAKNMLNFSDKKIVEIAEELGYSNTTHFIRQFKKVVGISPLKFRQSHKNNTIF